jgi:hypothetical protein
LAQIIQGALDCQNHFHKPDLAKGWVDSDFHIDFEKSQVICEACVDRLRKAIGLQPEQHPLDAKTFGNRRLRDME